MARELGINRKRVQRLMRRMGLQAIYPKRRTTRPAAGHRIYPYLLRNLAISRPDEVWAGDIIYMPRPKCTSRRRSGRIAARRDLGQNKQQVARKTMGGSSHMENHS